MVSAQDIEGFDNFKEWLMEDQKTFPDMQISIIDECAEENKDFCYVAHEILPKARVE